VLGVTLPASLVVLSACETGLGVIDGAGSVIGLQRAFLAAGARRVVSSLWRVSDLGTALIMKHFFRQLREHAPAAALQRAQQKVRQRLPHPAFWAGFRLDGAP
jgi:CHAT domain-containing protein